MATSRSEVQETLFSKIDEAAQRYDSPADLLRLAEAFAWVTNPNQPHGGSGNQA